MILTWLSSFAQAENLKSISGNVTKDIRMEPTGRGRFSFPI